MGDFIAATLAALISFYAVVCSVAVPVAVYRDWSKERECAKAHGVYACASTVVWSPVKEGVK